MSCLFLGEKIILSSKSWRWRKHDQKQSKFILNKSLQLMLYLYYYGISWVLISFCVCESWWFVCAECSLVHVLLYLTKNKHDMLLFGLGHVHFFYEHENAWFCCFACDLGVAFFRNGNKLECRLDSIVKCNSWWLTSGNSWSYLDTRLHTEVTFALLGVPFHLFEKVHQDISHVGGI